MRSKVFESVDSRTRSHKRKIADLVCDKTNASKRLSFTGWKAYKAVHLLNVSASDRHDAKQASVLIYFPKDREMTGANDELRACAVSWRISEAKWKLASLSDVESMSNFTVSQLISS